MRTFVLGDIHGAAKALEQCFERSEFDKKNDLLIQLGGVVDRHDEVFECVEIYELKTCLEKNKRN